MHGSSSAAAPASLAASTMPSRRCTRSRLGPEATVPSECTIWAPTVVTLAEPAAPVGPAATEVALVEAGVTTCNGEVRGDERLGTQAWMPATSGSAGH